MFDQIQYSISVYYIYYIFILVYYILLDVILSGIQKELFIALYIILK